MDAHPEIANADEGTGLLANVATTSSSTKEVDYLKKENKFLKITCLLTTVAALVFGQRAASSEYETEEGSLMGHDVSGGKYAYRIQIGCYNPNISNERTRDPFTVRWNFHTDHTFYIDQTVDGCECTSSEDTCTIEMDGRGDGLRFVDIKNPGDDAMWLNSLLIERQQVAWKTIGGFDYGGRISSIVVRWHLSLELWTNYFFRFC